MSYQGYKQARDAAWRTLISCKISSLPVDVRKVGSHLGYQQYSYRSADKTIRYFHLEEQRRISDGFTVCLQSRAYIFYDDTCSIGRQRFTVAHEIGHLVLGHLQAGGYTTHNINISDQMERQANQFAARLLAPACVLHAMGVTSAEEISQLCHISMQAAQARAARLAVLDQRGKYLSHPLERLVADQFRDFLAAQHRQA